MNSNYLLCVHDDQGAAYLTVHKMYSVGRPLPGDELAHADGLVRVIDDSGANYLYPAKWFVPVVLSPGRPLPTDLTTRQSINARH